MSKTKSISIQSLFNGLLLILLGGWIWWYTTDFPSLEEGYPGPTLFPRIIALGFIFCGLILLFYEKKISFRVVSGSILTKGTANIILCLGLLFIFPYAKDQIGFLFTLGILCFSFGLLFQVQILKAAVTAIITILLIHLIFVTGLGLSL